MGRVRRAVFASIALLWVALLAAGPAHAHRTGESQLLLTVDAQTVHGEWKIGLHELAPVFALGTAVDDLAAARAMVAARPDLEAYVLDRLRLRADGVPCVITPGSRSVAERPQGLVLLLNFDAQCAAALRVLAVTYRLLFDTDRSHIGLLKLQAGDFIRAAVFTADSAEQAFALHAASKAQRAEDGRRGLIGPLGLLVMALALVAAALIVMARGRPAHRAWAMRFGAAAIGALLAGLAAWWFLAR